MAEQDTENVGGIEWFLPNGVTRLTTKPWSQTRVMPSSGPSSRRNQTGGIPIDDEGNPLATTFSDNATVHNHADSVLQEALWETGLTLRTEESLMISPTVRGEIRNGNVLTPARVEVPVAPNESAIVLVEREGAYEWILPEQTSVPLEEENYVRNTVARKLIFYLDGSSIRSSSSTVTRGSLVTDIENFVENKMKTYIFTFVADVVAENAMRLLEQDKNDSWVQLYAYGNPDTVLDPSQWKPIADLVPLVDKHHELQGNATPVRILLFIHGTFSTTVGSFGGLAATDWGRVFLQQATKSYDLILGYDHKTLIYDPLENAKALFAELKKAFPENNGDARPKIDVICYSRGGLVFRSLVEDVIPKANFKANFGPCIFVAAANGGTHLAHPENWKALLDTYTNLTSAVLNITGLLPGAKPYTLAAKALLKGIALFVKVFADQSLTAEKVPGLAAMIPNGKFIRYINSIQEGQPLPEATQYYAITSIFDMEADDKESVLKPGVASWLLTHITKRLFKSDNDLVVDTSFMTFIEPQEYSGQTPNVTSILRSPYIRDQFDFGRTRRVDHLCYFLRPETVSALTGFLQLSVEPESLVRRGITTGQHVLPTLPAQVSTHLLSLNAQLSAGDCFRSMDKGDHRYIVIRRSEEKDYYYVFTSKELKDRYFKYHPSTDRYTDNRSLTEALDLYETDALPATISIAEAKLEFQQRLRQSQTSLNLNRIIVLDGTEPRGVLAQPPLESLASLLSPGSHPPVDNEYFPVKPVRRGDNDLPRSAVPLALGRPVRSLELSVQKSFGLNEDDSNTRFFHAEMPAQVTTAKATIVLVTISRESIESTFMGSIQDVSGVPVQSQKTLTLRLVPIRNFQVTPPGTVANRSELVKIIDFDTNSDDSLLVDFRVYATDMGPGEIRIYAEQDNAVIVILTLTPVIVPNPSPSLKVLVTTPPIVLEIPAVPKAANGMRVELEVQEKINGLEVRLLYRVQTTVMGTRKTPIILESSTGMDDLKREVQDIYAMIDNCMANDSTSAGIHDLIRQLRGRGSTLFRNLFPDQLRQLLWDNRDAITSVQVLSYKPVIPWEIVHLIPPADANDSPNPAKSEFLAYKGLTHLVSGIAECPLVTIQEQRARYVIPSYAKASQLANLPAAKEEKLYVEKTFRATALNPSKEDLLSELSRPGVYNLLHFTCHGNASLDGIQNAKLALGGRIEVDGDGKYYYSEAISLANLEAGLRVGTEQNPCLVFINACEIGRSGTTLGEIGGFADIFIRRGAGIFVGALWSVFDASASSFAEYWYDALLSGKTLSEATTEARQRLAIQDPLTALAYTVYGLPHARVRLIP